MSKQINKIIIDWFYDSENGEQYTLYQIGKKVGGDLVVSIWENEDYMPTPCYIIEFENGKFIKSFNVSSVFYGDKYE